MSISAVGAASPQAVFQPLSGAGKPEAAEVAGAPDHDGDSDDRGTASAVSRGSHSSVNEVA